MKPSSTRFANLLLVTLIVTSALFGWFASADHFVRDLRFSAFDRPASGNLVFVDIDADTIESVGVWPWPRRIHAQMVDNLVAAGAYDIAMDVDFSAPSNPEDDAILADALERAGGFVMLAAFYQRMSNDGTADLKLPIETLAAHSQPVLVNVPVDRDGVARRYPRGTVDDGTPLPSLANAIAQRRGNTSGTFALDYSIDAQSVAVLSAKEVINGSFDPVLVAGKQVVIGASALELRDNLAVPRYGILPGAMVHIMAAETLMADRAIWEPGPQAVVPFLLVFALLLGILARSMRFRDTLVLGVFMSISVEAAAFWLQANFAIALDTMAIHAMVASLVVMALFDELGIAGIELQELSLAHNKTKNVLDQVIADNFDGVVVVDQHGEILAASRLAHGVLGQALVNGQVASLAGRDAMRLLPHGIADEMRKVLGDRQAVDADTSPRIAEMQAPDGKPLTVEYVITRSEVQSAGKSGDKQGADADSVIACLTFRDVTQKHKAAERLKYLAHHDPLTGALSLSRLQTLLNERREDDALRAQGVTMFMLNMTRFKAVNDTLGHSCGDEVLKQIVMRLKATHADLIARLGGDSFAIVLYGTLTSKELENFCRHALDRLTELYRLGEHQALLGARMGVTDSRVSGNDPEVLLSHADMALSAAKNIPGNAYAHYVPEMDDALNEKQEMELALRSALARNELSVNYQPQVELESGEIVGAEALVRWNHPQLGIVSPGRFIPVAEETGIILELGRWVLNTSCREVMNWPKDISLAVNFSPMQFEFGDVAAEVEQALKQSGLPPERLEVEITEGVLINNPSAIIEVLQRLQALGVKIALDDFGTGYSSMSYLGQLPVDKIKIDQCFVRGLPRDQESGAIVRAVMTLSESLDKKVIAEGIENADQAWMLRLAGCHLGQGFHFGRPLVASEMEARLAATSQTDSRLAG